MDLRKHFYIGGEQGLQLAVNRVEAFKLIKQLLAQVEHPSSKMGVESHELDDYRLFSIVVEEE